MKNFSLGFHPNPTKQNRISGRIPIYARFLIDGRKIERRLSSDYDLNVDELPKWNYASQRLDIKNSVINDYLGAIATKKRLMGLEKLMTNNGLTPEAAVVKLLAHEETEIEPTCIEYLDKYLNDIVEKFKVEGTKKNYRNAVKQLTTFLRLFKIEKLKLSEFTTKHAYDFKTYLESSVTELESKQVSIIVLEELKRSKRGKKSNQEVSSSTKIKNLKPIFKKALEEKLITSNPFTNIKIELIGEETQNISIHQLKRIYDLDFKDDTSLQYVKDLFIFMCVTGLSICDVHALSSHKFEVVDQKYHLFNQKRSKTKQKISQILSRYASEIVEKYWKGNWSIVDEKIFPTESDVSINRKLKIIGHLAKIHFPLVTKVGRITFKNLLREAKINDFLLIRKSMGWSNNKFIEDIYNRYTEQDFLEAKEKFDNYLNFHLKNVKTKQNELN